eukprot:m.315908 g.315908  ORF g.315908 m.315908 type:complete len:641 (+) comp20283_c0_seq1:387-2309(+)
MSGCTKDSCTLQVYVGRRHALLESAILFAQAMQPMQRVRLVAALVWLAMFLYWVHVLEDAVGLQPLRVVLVFAHLTAVTGCDEAILMNFAWMKSSCSWPYLPRVLTPGSDVTNYLGIASGRRCETQSIAGAGAFALHVLHALYLLLGSTFISDFDVVICMTTFLVAALFDTGVFHSARPYDLIKFLFATHEVFCRKYDNGILIEGAEAQGAGEFCLVLIAALYFWSGLSKLFGWFWAWVFQYQFLLTSPISFHFRHLYLDTKTLEPKLWSKLFGLCGAAGEMIVGLTLLFAWHQDLRTLALFMGLSMHVFICVCGIGPYRWNFEQMFFLWASFHLGEVGAASRTAPIFSLSAPAYGYFVATSVVVPLVGVFSPRLLGTWLGGFRSAMFHFAGNERHAGYLIHRSVLDHAAKHCTETGCPPSPTLRLLQRRAAEQGATPVTRDSEFLALAHWLDGMDVHTALVESVSKFFSPRGDRQDGPVVDFAAFDSDYVFAGVQWLKIYGICLNTKDDESVSAVHARYTDIVLQALFLDPNGSCPNCTPLPAAAPSPNTAVDGRVLVFGANPIPIAGMLAGLWSSRPAVKTWDMTDACAPSCCATCKATNVVGCATPLMPWAPLLEPTGVRPPRCHDNPSGRLHPHRD